LQSGSASDDNMAHALAPKATNTHIVCVILISLPRQQWLHERALLLH